ncbi:MAG: tRNA (guanosine(46)-N7)-methyltransferase TrmB [Gammaproteobacteria bacterium]|nr:tRNA (guanosine(46)-N7)-methyltransferase TrmB [Gammaproteobacteria bacterium]MBQ0839113.1 tRNA (guanosine(46)-N7)-methyltransferase TrmB [Gammaproteobacteria bacterium]
MSFATVNLTVSEVGDFRPEYKKKSIRSYVLRSGRMTDGQKRALEQHWPHFRLSLFAEPIADWAEVFGREVPVVLEIGFGMGDSLLAMAENEPDTNFVGIEVYPPGAGRLVNRAAELGLSNLRIFLADATDVLDDCIPDASLARVQLYFPDPWHKKKHNKRRIVQRAFVEKICTKLAVDGHFHMATDWQPYAEYMAEVMLEVQGFANMAAEGVYSPRPDYRPTTKFEKRGQRLGHGVWDLLYRRVS